MIVSRRVVPKPYAFEWILIANVAGLAIVARLWSLQFITTFPEVVRAITLPVVVSTILGMTVRGAVAARQGTWRRYRAVITSWRWLIDTVRLMVAEIVLTFVYAWLKLVVPVLHPRLFDEELWRLDRTICFGLSPNIFLLTLFSNSLFLKFIDWAYANIFLLTIMITFAYFLSSPSRRLRVAFMTSNVLLWVTGVYLYLLIPSLGPAYRFPQIWFEYASQLQTTQRLQALLMRNYANMLTVSRGGNNSVSLTLGIAAFPSLHVGWQATVALWMRREWIYGEVLFAFFLFVIFVGSMITGWHYLVDSIAGVLLAAGAYVVVSRPFKLVRWRALQKAIRR